MLNIFLFYQEMDKNLQFLVLKTTSMTLSNKENEYQSNHNHLIIIIIAHLCSKVSVNSVKCTRNTQSTRNTEENEIFLSMSCL